MRAHSGQRLRRAARGLRADRRGRSCRRGRRARPAPRRRRRSARHAVGAGLDPVEAEAPVAAGRRPQPGGRDRDPGVGDRLARRASDTVPAIRWNSVSVRAGPSEIRVRIVWVRTSGPRTNAAPDAICVWTTKSIEALYWPPTEVQKSAFSSRGRPTDVSASRQQRAAVERALDHLGREPPVGEEDREHLGEQPVLVLDRLRPRGDRVGQLELERRRRDDARAVRAHLVRRALGAHARLAQVVEEEVDGRVRELARPLLRRRVEGDVDALEAVALELAPQQRPQCLVEVRDRGVQRYVDDQRHASRPYPSAGPAWEMLRERGLTAVPATRVRSSHGARPRSRAGPRPARRPPSRPRAPPRVRRPRRSRCSARPATAPRGASSSRWAKHPDPEQKGVMVPDSSAGEYTRFNPPKNE